MERGERMEVAAVTFEAPHGADSLVVWDSDVVEFGRAGSCRIRFAYAPLVDAGVPRVAGRLVAAAGRLIVEAPEGTGRSALEVVAEGRPPVLVGAGDAFGPSEREFRIRVHGEQRTWQLDVAVRPMSVRSSGGGSDVPTRRHELALTGAQRRVIDAYLEPMRRGRLEPATHREVAEALGCHQNSAREVLYSVWTALFAAGVPMPDVADKRVAVAEAIRLHRLLT